MNNKEISKLIEAWEVYYPDEELVLMTFDPPMMGVFDNEEDLKHALKKKSIQKVYSVVHEVKKESLKNRPRNCLRAVKPGEGLSWQDIAGYRYLFIDIDVVGLKEKEEDNKRNATEEEHKEALALTEQIMDFLEKRGFPVPILTDSANGYHLLYGLEMEMNEENDQLIKRAIQALSGQMKNDTCRIDTVVADRGRKIKIPGSRNGEDRTNPDCRVSEIISYPEELVAVTKEQLQALAALGTKKKPWKGSGPSESEEKEDLAEWAEKIGTYFSANGGQPFIDFYLSNGHLATMNMHSTNFRNVIRKKMCDEMEMKMVSNEQWKSFMGYLEVLAFANEKEIEIYNRIGKDGEGNIYYDLQNEQYQTVKIMKEGYTIVPTPGMLFQRNDTDKPQTCPEETDDFDLEETLSDLFNFSSQEEMRLFILWLVSCFFPGQGHPILSLTGAHGSGKSTICSMVQDIISPQVIERSSMPKKEENLIVMLANRAICVFDNCSKISDAVSDIWCQCVTGGTYTKRKLYEDLNTINVPLKGIIVINGCDNVVEKEDLASRMLHFDIKPLENEKLCTDEELKSRFQKSKPKILDFIFRTVSDVLEDMEERPDETLKINYVIRLTSFQKLATRIAAVLWEEDAEYVEELLKQNENSVYTQILESNPVAILITKFMEKKAEWRGSVSELFQLLDEMAFENTIDRRSREYPKNPSKLSYRLNSLAKVLEWTGIYFYIQNVGSHKEIKIRNQNVSKKKISKTKKVL